LSIKQKDSVFFNFDRLRNHQDDMASNFIGKVIDNYRILENLGIGGMGVVYKAIHIKLEKLFALKMIAPGQMMNENFIRRFQTEAKALARFEDLNIVRIYDLRCHNDQWFIVMEYVEGVNLLEKIKKDGAFHWQDALLILKQILTAIGHAHNAGIIHRDIKPNNIMLTPDGMVKITDFGLAKDQSVLSNTMTVASGGTLYYMSPEHVKGFAFTDKRSDIYSIGMTFYEMITGSVPFKDMNSDFDIREAIVRKEFEKPTSLNPEIPVELEAIVMKSIAKNPKNRYQTTNEMLRQVLDFEAENAQAGSKKVFKVKRLFVLFSFFKKLTADAKAYLTLQVDRFNHRPWFPVRIALAGLSILFLLILFFSLHWSKSESENIDQSLVSDLTITTAPVSAIVYLNGDSIGQSPLLNFSTSPGQYNLRLLNAGYQLVDTTIFLDPAHSHKLAFSLKTSRKGAEPNRNSTPAAKTKRRKVSSLVTVQINSNPAEGQIWINEKYRGQTPATISDLPPGQYSLKIQKAGFRIYSSRLELTQTNNRPITATLTPFTGGLLIRTVPESVLVKLDGKPMSGNKSPYAQSHLPVGKYTLEAVKKGYSSYRTDIEIKQDQISEFSINLFQLKGMLTIQVKPWGSIYLNDHLQKEATDLKYEIELPVDEYKIRVIHPTLGKWEKILAIEAGSENDIVVDFNLKIPVKIWAFDEIGNHLSGEIFLDDQPVGKTTPVEILMRTGLHRLAVKMDGYVNQEKNREILVDAKSAIPQKFIFKKMDTPAEINH
jgi:serine/threonine protein kinase